MLIHLSLSHRKMVVMTVSDIEKVLHNAFPLAPTPSYEMGRGGWLVGDIKYLWLDIFVYGFCVNIIGHDSAFNIVCSET